LRTPITYYGGKQRLAKTIIEKLPDHEIYCEPFCGGAAVFFAKEPSKVEILNDTNRELINFYQVIQRDFSSLESEIKITLHSRDQHRKAEVVYANPDMFSEVKRAWAIWVLANQGFSGMLDGSFGYCRTGSSTRKIRNKKEAFTWELGARLDNVQIESTDALRIIKSRDTEKTLFYCDPPYFNSDCGHYDGYSKRDFEELLITLSEIKGKFLLSSYPSPILTDYRKQFFWTSMSMEMPRSIGKRQIKVEVLTANYPL